MTKEIPAVRPPELSVHPCCDGTPAQAMFRVQVSSTAGIHDDRTPKNVYGVVADRCSEIGIIIELLLLL